MAELTITLCNQQVTLKNAVKSPEYFTACLGPFLELCWSSNILTFWSCNRPCEPSAMADTIEEAARKLDAAMCPFRPWFRGWEQQPAQEEVDRG